MRQKFIPHMFKECRSCQSQIAKVFCAVQDPSILASIPNVASESEMAARDPCIMSASISSCVSLELWLKHAAQSYLFLMSCRIRSPVLSVSYISVPPRAHLATPQQGRAIPPVPEQAVEKGRGLCFVPTTGWKGQRSFGCSKSQVRPQDLPTGSREAGSGCQQKGWHFLF